MLERMEASYDELVKEVARSVPLQRLAETLRLLVAEGVSIRNQRALLEAMVEWGAREPDAARLADHLRASLARQISHQYADRNRVITAFVLTPAVEEQLRAYLRRADNPRELLNEHASRSLLIQLRAVCKDLAEGDRTVLLVHPELRRSLRRLVVRGELELAVLSFRELAGEYNLQAIGSISLTETTGRRTADGASLTSMATA
jgi:type III secretion protein V